MKKKVVGNILKVAICVLITVLLYSYLCILFVPKDLNDRGSGTYYVANSIKFEEKNTLDIIMYGNSDLSSAIIPMKIYKDAGITSYLNWGNQQSLNTVRKQVKNDLKNQKPKMIVLEVDCIYYENKIDTNSFLYTNEFLAPFVFHTRWKELELNDFINKKNFSNDPYKGYMYITHNGKYKYEDYMGNSTEIEPIEKSVVRDVKAIKKMCDKNGVNLLFIEAPSPSSWSMKKHNGVKALAKELGVPFIDYNVQLDGFNFDYNNEFRDYGNHCNYQGALKITNYLIDFIDKNYDFEDRRNTEKYAQWDTYAKEYNKYYY